MPMEASWASAAEDDGVISQEDPTTEEDPAGSGSRRYAITVCVFVSLGGLFFGYDQGVTGGVLVMRSFLRDFCVDFGKNSEAMCANVAASHLPANWLTFTTLYNVTYYLGCIAGAFLGGFVADRCGRRVTVFTAGLLFCVGTIWIVVSPAQGHTTVLLGRVVQGLGVGNSSFSLPLFGAEVAPKELRGLLSGFMQMTVVTGLLLANSVNVLVQDSRIGWRLANTVAMIAPIVVMLGIFCVPESPRWVYKHKGRQAAIQNLQRIRCTTNVQSELEAIGEQLALEGDAQSWRELWHQTSVRRRLYIAMALQLLQQATGVNPVFTYGGQIFEDVLGNGVLSLLILTSVNFVSTIPAMRWVDSYGRRQLLLIGAAGMTLAHFIAAITSTVGCHGNTENAGCSKVAAYVMVAATAVFVFHFAISWGPICWIYPAEIFPLNVRAKAVSISTMTNWAMGAVMIGVPKLFPYLQINGVFFLFGALCACAGGFVYFMCPETKGVLLEDIEQLFGGGIARAPPAKDRATIATSTSTPHPFVSQDSPAAA